MSFDHVWPEPVLDFKHMCLGLAKIYSNGKIDNVSNVDHDDL